MDGVGSELSSGIESLELPGSVLVGREGVLWGLGVLGRLLRTLLMTSRAVAEFS